MEPTGNRPDAESLSAWAASQFQMQTAEVASRKRTCEDMDNECTDGNVGVGDAGVRVLTTLYRLAGGQRAMVDIRTRDRRRPGARGR